MVPAMKKDIFLANKSNKHRFIQMLSECLEQAGCQCIHASGDADCLIVETAVNAANHKEIIVVADDTDILVLLCYHVDSSTKTVLMLHEPKKGTSQKIWNIHCLKSALGPCMCLHLPFLHALLGCDTTSRLFNVGKAVAIKKIQRLTALCRGILSD